MCPSVSTVAFLALFNNILSSTGAEVSTVDKGIFVTESYFFPYLCSVVFGIEEHKTADWVSTCTILNKQYVAISIENINRPRPVLIWPWFYHLLDALRIHAGSVFGTPEKLDKTTMGKLRHHQSKMCNRLWVPIDAVFVSDENKKPRMNHYNALRVADRFNAPNLTEDIKFDVIGGAEWGVGFLELFWHDKFEWNTQILPAPVFETNHTLLAAAVERRVEEMENNPPAQTSCSVGGWDHKTSKLLFYQVIHVPFADCQAQYCDYDPKACNRFPRYKQHVCFKSLVYGDLCPEDRGAALYCSSFNRSILGILTTAPNCGYKNLPNVYTLIHHVANAFLSLNQKIERFTNTSAYDILPPRL